MHDLRNGLSLLIPAPATSPVGGISLDLANVQKAGDTTIEGLNTSLAILKEVGEALQNVPLVKSVSGIVLVLIKIRDVCPCLLSPNLS
jgi:hypothetical protein